MLEPLCCGNLHIHDTNLLISVGFERRLLDLCAAAAALATKPRQTRESCAHAGSRAWKIDIGFGGLRDPGFCRDHESSLVGASG